MSDFKMRLQKLINSSHLDHTISFDKFDKKQKKDASKMKRDWSSFDIKLKNSKSNKSTNQTQSLSAGFVSSHTKKIQFIKLTKGSFPSKMFSTIQVNKEDNSKTVENIIRSCTPQDIHKEHNEPILISHVNVNEPECALRNNGRMKRKMYWMNQNFQFKNNTSIKTFNPPIRGKNSNLNVNKSEIYSRSPNQKNRIVFEGEFKKKIKRHLFENDNTDLCKRNHYKHNGLLMEKVKKTVNNCRVDEEVEKYRKDFMKIMKTNDLGVLNK